MIEMIMLSDNKKSKSPPWRRFRGGLDFKNAKVKLLIVFYPPPAPPGRGRHASFYRD
jgi:hypothetical protein